MAKKVVKKSVKKKVGSLKGTKSSANKTTEKILVENFASLQNVMTNLSIKFNDLSEQISKLLELFELSAKALGRKDINFTKPMDEGKLIRKLDGLAEQNKIIARGLTMLHEQPQQNMPSRQVPPQQMTPPRAPAPQEKYQKSAFS